MTYEENMLATTGGYLEHFGIKGQKWGVRRFQNPDGTLTEAGKQHYSVSTGGNSKFDKKFTKERKKLEKWTERSDQLGQAKKALEYDRKAKNASRIGKAALAVALPAAGTAALTEEGTLSQIKKDLGFAENQGARVDRMFDTLEKRESFKKQSGLSDDAFNTLTNATYASASTGRLAGDIRRHLLPTNSQAKVLNPLSKAVAAGSAITAAGAFGKAAYDKAKANTAKKYASDKGHAKAVARRQEQFNKMMNTFAGTPYADLLKKQK